MTATAVVTTAQPGLVKTVSPASDGTHNFRIGDVVTYSLALTVPPGLVVWWPYVYDGLPAGLRYVTGTFGITSTLSFAGSSPLEETGPWRSQGAAARMWVWWARQAARIPMWAPCVGPPAVRPWSGGWTRWTTPPPGSVGLVTVTFQAQLMGVDLSGAQTQPNAATQAFTQLRDGPVAHHRYKQVRNHCHLTYQDKQHGVQ